MSSDDFFSTSGLVGSFYVHVEVWPNKRTKKEEEHVHHALLILLLRKRQTTTKKQ